MMKPENKIMIIENDPQLLNSLAFTLKRREYQVTVGSNKEEVLKCVEDARDGGNPFSLLIIDIQLPGLAELELIETLRKKSIPIPVLVLTAYGNKDFFLRLKERHIEDFLTKPFNSDELVKRVSSMLKRQSGI